LGVVVVVVQRTLLVDLKVLMVSALVMKISCIDADTYGDLGSVSTMTTEQWADQNPGGFMLSDRKPPSMRWL
jgi:hypothetical protein